MPNSLRAGTIPGTTRALACRWMRPRIQPRRGAHAAGVPFSAVRRKLRPTNLPPHRRDSGTGERWFGRAAQTRTRAACAPRSAPTVVKTPGALVPRGFSARARKTAPEGGCAPRREKADSLPPEGGTPLRAGRRSARGCGFGPGLLLLFFLSGFAASSLSRAAAAASRAISTRVSSAAAMAPAGPPPGLSSCPGPGRFQTFGWGQAVSPPAREGDRLPPPVPTAPGGDQRSPPRMPGPSRAQLGHRGGSPACWRKGLPDW